jgi:urease accessory protein UreF
LTHARDDIAALVARPVPERPHAFAPAAEIAVMRHEEGGARLFAN